MMPVHYAIHFVFFRDAEEDWRHVPGDRHHPPPAPGGPHRRDRDRPHQGRRQEPQGGRLWK